MERLASPRKWTSPRARATSSRQTTKPPPSTFRHRRPRQRQGAGRVPQGREHGPRPDDGRHRIGDAADPAAVCADLHPGVGCGGTRCACRGLERLSPRRADRPLRLRPSNGQGGRERGGPGLGERVRRDDGDRHGGLQSAYLECARRAGPRRAGARVCEQFGLAQRQRRPLAGTSQRHPSGDGGRLVRDRNGNCCGRYQRLHPSRLALGDWSKFENLIVETAGFAAFPVQTPPGEAAVDSLVLQLHASTPEETVLQFMCSAHASEVGTASICVPIPGGSEISTGTPTARRLPAYWLPVSDPAFAFGSPQPMAPNTRYTAETDGFAFGQLGAGSDGSRGWLEIRTLDSAGQEEPLYAGCAGHLFMGDDHQMAMAGTLLPIPRGKDWLVKTFASWGSVDAEVFWIPVNPI